jgi:hypothetical protein
MYWSDDRLALVGKTTTVMRTTGGRIHDIWPGPLRGLFSIWTDRGIGLLLGTGDQTIGRIAAPNAILRSPTPDVIFIASTTDSSTRTTTVQELRGRAKGREIAHLRGSLLDFDASAQGALFLLYPTGDIFIAGATDDPVAVLIPNEFRGPAKRVFVSPDQKTLYVLSDLSFCTLGSETDRTWSCSTFDPTRNAVVRNYQAGTVVLEPRVNIK